MQTPHTALRILSPSGVGLVAIPVSFSNAFFSAQFASEGFEAIDGKAPREAFLGVAPAPRPELGSAPTPLLCLGDLL